MAQGFTSKSKSSKSKIPAKQTLPELLTDKQKQDLSKLTVKRARLLVFCIDTIKNEMDAKGFEFYENSVRSLGVSLFISISKYIS